jgi:hypothetical protein
MEIITGYSGLSPHYGDINRQAMSPNHSYLILAFILSCIWIISISFTAAAKELE